MYLKFGEHTFFGFNNIPIPIAQILQQEGLVHHKTDEEPREIIIFDFVEKIENEKNTVTLPDGMGLLDKHFFIQDHNGKKVVIGQTFFSEKNHTILVENSINPSFFFNLLEDILKIKLLEEGKIFCHAASFEYGGKGVLLLGWGSSGKTCLLLYFLKRGAFYIGDDRTILADDGVLYPFIKHPELFWFEAKEFKEIANSISLFNQFIFNVFRISDYLTKLNRTLFSRFNRFINRILKSHRFVTLDISKFVKLQDVHLDVVIVLFRSNQNRIIINNSRDKSNIIEMLTNNILFEDAELLKKYYAFKFLLPNSENKYCEHYKTKISQILTKTLENKTVYLINVPVSVKIEELGIVLKECITNN